MHQSKKEMLVKQWNQKMSVDFQNELDKEETKMDTLVSQEINLGLSPRFENRK